MSDWADVEDYRTLEDVFTSRDFGHPLANVGAAAGAVRTVGRKASPLRPYDRVVAATSAIAAALLLIVAGLVVVSDGPQKPPIQYQDWAMIC